MRDPRVKAAANIAERFGKTPVEVLAVTPAEWYINLAGNNYRAAEEAKPPKKK